MPIEVKNNNLAWKQTENGINMIIVLVALIKKMPIKQFIKETGVTKQTWYNYTKILRNDPNWQYKFINNQADIKEAAKFNRLQYYAAATNGLLLDNKTLWECLLSEEKQAFVWSKQSDNLSISEIAKLAGVKQETLTSTLIKLKDLTEEKRMIYWIYKEAEKNFDSNVQLRVIQIAWNSLRLETERMFYVLTRIKEGMNIQEIALQAEIDESNVIKYIDIAYNHSLKEIVDYLLTDQEAVKKEEIMSNIEIKANLAIILQELNETIAIMPDVKSLQALKPQYLGKNSTVTSLLKSLKKYDNEIREEVSKWINDTKVVIISKINDRIFQLKQAKLKDKPAKRTNSSINNAAKKQKLKNSHIESQQQETFASFSGDKQSSIILNSEQLAFLESLKIFPSQTILSFQSLVNNKPFVWERSSRIKKMIYCLLLFEKGLSTVQIGKTVNKDDETIRKQRKILEKPSEIQAQYFNGQKTIIEAAKYKNVSNQSKTSLIIEVEWNKLNQENRVLHLLLRRNLGFKNNEIAEQLGINELEVASYFYIVNYDSLMKFSLNGILEQAEGLKSFSESQAKYYITQKRIHEAIEQLGVLSRLAENDSSEWKEELVPIVGQEELVPVAPKESEPQEINRPKRVLTPQQEAILAGLKPCKASNSSQPPRGPFSVDDDITTSIFDTTPEGTWCFSSLQNNEFHSHPMDDSYPSEYESSVAQ